MPTSTQRLANEIAAQFHHVPADDGVRAVATHIRQFWDPRMRAQLLADVDSGDTDDLDPLVVTAAALIRK